MRTLVIHPLDPSTDFLRQVYVGLPETTVVRDHVDAGINEMLDLIHESRRIIMLGHGTPNGLMSVGQFSGSYVIHDGFNWRLKGKPDNIYIWCNADQFVQRNNLPSDLYSGMFISEVGEAVMMGLDGIDLYQVNQSNHLFARTLNAALRHDDMSLLRDAYPTSHKNPVVAYNAKRLYGL